MKSQSVLFIVIALFVVFFLLAKLLGIEMMDEGYDAETRRYNDSCDRTSDCVGDRTCKKAKDGKMRCLN